MREEEVADLSARYDAIAEHNKVLLARAPQLEEPKAQTVAIDTKDERDPSLQHRDAKSAVDLDNVAANLWWSYIWHSLSTNQSDGAPSSPPKPMDAMAAFEAVVENALQNRPNASSSEDLAAQVLSLQSIVAELKAATNAQAIEVTGVRQVLPQLTIFDACRI